MSNKLLRRGVSYLLAFLMIFTTIFATNFYSAKAEEIDIEENTLSEDDGLLLDDAAVADDVDIADEEILEDETADAKEVVLSEPEGNPTFVNSGLVIRSEETTDFAKSTELQIAAEYNFYLGINQGDDAESIDNSNVISLDSADNVTLFKFYPGDDEPTDYPGDYTITSKGNDLYTLTVKGCSCGEYGFRWDGDDGYKGSSVTFMLTAPVLNVFDSSAHNEENNTYVFNKENELATNPTLSFEDALYGKKDFIVFIPNNSYDSSKTSIAIRGLNKIKAGKEEDWTEENWTTMMVGKGDERVITDHVDGMYVNGFDEKKANFNGAEIDGEVCKVVMKKDEANMPAISSYCVEIGTITDDVFTPAYRVSYAPYVCDENTFADVVVDDAEFCGENVLSIPYLKGDADKKPITGLDYSERSYKNNIYIGEASVELTPSADFAGAKAFTKTFKITPMDLATYIDDENIDVNTYAYYNPEEKKVTSYEIYSEELYENVDYTVEYGYVFDEANNEYVKASGDLDLDTVYYAKLTGMGKFTGEYYAYYYLRKKEIRRENFIVVSEPSFDGTVKTGADFEYRCVVDGKKLVYGKDFVMIYNGEEFAQTEYREYYVTIEGIGNYSGQFNSYVYINAGDLSKAVVKYINADGKEVDLPKEFTFGQDLSLAVYLNGTKISPELYEAGLYRLDLSKKTWQLVISPKNYGFIDADYIKEITLNPNFTAANDITVEFVEGGSYAYNGESVCPSVIVKQGEKELDKEDYSVNYENNLNVGKGKVIVSGKRDYFGEIEKEFTITSVDSKDIYVEVSATAEYNPILGEAIPDITVKATEDSDVYFPEEDYKVTLTGNKVPGEASWKIEFTGKNVVGDSKEGKFTVLAAAMNDGNIWVYEDQFFTSTTDMVVPNLDVYYDVDPHTSVVLKAGTDYDLTVAAADENGKVEDGKIKVPSEGSYAYTATITGKGNFSGTVECAFYANLLSPVDISGYMVTGLNPVYEVTSIPFPEFLTGYIVVKDGETTVDSELYSIDCDKSELNEYGIGKLSFIVNGTAPAAKGSIVVSVEVVPTDLSKREVSLSMVDSPYVDYETLEVMDATFQVNVSGYDSLNDEDYSFTYALKNDDGTFTDYENVPFDSEAEIFVKIVAKAHFTGESDYMSVGCVQKIYLEDIQNPYAGQYFTVSAPKNFKYDGKAHKQKLTVKLGDQKFVVGKDCELVYYDIDKCAYVDEPVNAGRYVVEVGGIGKYWGTVTPVISGKALSEENAAIFEVTPASISKAKITYTKSFDHDASKFEESGFNGWGEVSKVQVGKKELIEGVDYKVVFENNYKPGVATIKISGIGNYTGIVTKTYTIKGSVDINDEDVDVYVDPEALFSPAGAKPEINIFYKGEQLVENKDYTVTYSNNKKITTDKKATVTIKGKGQYKGTRATKYEFSVVAGKFSELEDRMTYGKTKNYGLPMIPGASLYLYGATYTGKAQSPDPQLKIDGKALKLGKDYEIKFVSAEGMFSSVLNTTNPLPGGVLLDSVIESGQYGVVFIGLGNYAGEYYPENLSLFVTAPDVSKIKVKTKTLDYTGSDAEGAITSVMYGKTKLVENRDYYVSYNYGYKNYLLEDALSIESGIKYPSFKPVIGNSINIAFDNDEELDSISAGKKTAYVVGIGNYSSIGAKKVSYTIKGFDISKAKFTVKNISYCPEGYYAEFDPFRDITATYKANGETIKLIFGVDYTVTNYEDIMNNFKVGKHTAKVEGLGQFSGTKKVTVKVVPVELTMDTFEDIWYAVGLDKGYAPYNKKGVKDLIGDVYYYDWTLKEGVDYTVTYKNNKNIASSDSKKAPTVTIKFKGGFKGKITTKFDIVKNDLICIDYSYTGGTDADYKIKTVFESDVNGKLKEGTDYKLVGYYYDGDFAVENNGKLSYRKNGEAVQEGDKIAAGTRIYAVYEGTGKYYEGEQYVFYTVKPATK